MDSFIDKLRVISNLDKMNLEISIDSLAPQWRSGGGGGVQTSRRHCYDRSRGATPFAPKSNLQLLNFPQIIEDFLYIESRRNVILGYPQQPHSPSPCLLRQ